MTAEDIKNAIDDVHFFTEVLQTVPGKPNEFVPVDTEPSVDTVVEAETNDGRKFIRLSKFKYTDGDIIRTFDALILR